MATLGLGPRDRVLQPGDLAPDFNLPASDGKTYSLADYRGVKPVVIAWFPKANTKT
jgi:peroxiredoxin Q/BCP